mmetsp:Transcript_19687/g.19786  ORF Transcript_19687/g.19786 Transcript_19687/m.19786 type:complete len:552 (+) Transcript_19687:294-1949(+)|eukprot:CAMPEP_0182434000 /NCGR_PEP_ID=MMETSP1167-20130531/66953_1 /TAXON_ID=2988 /ORGANISM="Mallomonas Sp, Strain CCMP3275" /LENGTH=551 /DNA_ID=CAMNT_0024623355 /DNA_START=190 /DNA_END=1845 /DNA_ORIENTATION=-
MSREYHLGRFQEDAACDDEVRAVVDHIWTKFSNTIQEKWLASIEIPISTEVAMAKIRNVVGWATLGHDGDFTGKGSFEQNTPEKEPSPVSIDPWARGAVPVRKIVHVDDSVYRGTGTGTGSEGTRSVSGASSERSSVAGSSRSGHSSQRKKSLTSNRRNPGSPSRTAKEITGIIELEDDDRSSGGPFSTDAGQLYEMLQKTEKQKKNSESIEGIKDEFSLIQDDIDRVAKEMKGKKFTLDSEGKPVPVSSVEPDRLPPFAYQLGLNITNGGSDPSLRKDGIPKRKKGKFRTAGSRDVDDSYFVSSASLATSLSTTQIVLNPGVSLRTDDTVREGPPNVEDPSKPSRKTFMRNRANTSTMSVLGSYSTGSAESPAGFGAEKSGPQPTDALALSRSAATPGSLKASASFRGTGSKFVDLDAMEGGRKVEPKPTDPSPVQDDSEMGLGPVVTLGKPHPGRLPVKPSSTQGEVVKQLFGGTEKRGPKDRENPRAQAVLAPTNRKKGPPAPVGQIVRRSSQATSAGEDSFAFSVTAPAVMGDGRIKTEPITRQLFK